jgi:Glycosyl hydrolases family 18
LALGLTLVLAGIAARGCIWRPGTHHAGAYFDRGQNAVWLSVDWSKDAHTADEVLALADALTSHHVQTVFVYVSYLKPGGYFNPAFDHATEFVRQFKAERQDATVEAWVGIPVDKPSIGGHGHARIDDPAVRAKIADFCHRLVSEMGFDGVHLDPEPIPGGDADTLQLMDDVRAAIGRDKILSLATRSIIPVWGDAPVPSVFGLWQAGYYRRVAEHVDEIAVMTYDSTMPVPRLYEQWARFQVIGITRATQGTGARLLFGVPTSEEETFTHHPRAENMRSGLHGVIAGLNDADAMSQAVTGVAIYPHWETDAAEWAVYDRIWLGK